MKRILQVHPDDDMIVALERLGAGDVVDLAGERWEVSQDIPAKHKFARRDFQVGDKLKMYGLVVGEVVQPIQSGERLTTANLKHAVEDADPDKRTAPWTPPDVSAWEQANFAGYWRADGRVGTRNYWIVVPLVFCQNRNINVLREALCSQLGYSRPNRLQTLTRQLVDLHSAGCSSTDILEVACETISTPSAHQPLFPGVDGIKFLTHEGGCGGLYDDARTLCGLLAGYINHPNVAGATVLSLGCQKSQIATLEAELHSRNSQFDKPLYIFEQQQEGTEERLLDKALRHTFAGVAGANELRRDPAPLAQLNVGVECGGSDGFSGISANPAIGHCSDLIAGLSGTIILSEFPELSGCEKELVSRCEDRGTGVRFLEMMRAYEARTRREGGGFDQNPSPGNIADGLITDAMKSAGAAKKGGSSPVVDVLDYPEPAVNPGLNLLCTPGGDVESTTAMAGAGATIQLFSTGLGTPTGNPICPVIKISSNSALAQKMPDIIDVDAGRIIQGQSSIEDVGKELLELVIETASGRYVTCSEKLGQDDFIPWKRGISI